MKNQEGIEMWRKALVLGLVLMAIGMVVGGATGDSYLTYYMAKNGASPEATLVTDLGLGTAGLIWSTAFGIASAGLGFAVGLAWMVGQAL
ncbi:hypothetical protein [Pyrococcus horikoshii]|nr:hypothetical protein [Pyrococcus horikoshii]HII61277.1 hypothetical protein [Pyrococcus horikoshii]